VRRHNGRVRIALFTVALALSLAPPADACRTWINAHRIFHDSVPNDAPESALALEVVFTDLNVYDTAWPKTATARARVVRVLRGSFEADEVDIGVRVSTCDTEPVNMRGIIVGEFGPWADRTALIPVLAEPRD